MDSSNVTNVTYAASTCSHTFWQNTAPLITTYAVCAIGFMLNFIELVIFYRKRNELSTNDTVLISLSLADLVYVLITSITITLYVRNIKVAHGYFYDSLISFAIFNSVFHLLLMSTDRLIAIRKPLWHHVNVSKKKLTILCLAIWLLTAVLIISVGFRKKALLHTIMLSNHTSMLNKRDALNIDIHLTVSLVLLVCIVFLLIYPYILLKIIKGNKNICRVQSRNWKLAKTSGLICASFILVNAPLAIGYLIRLCNTDKWLYIVQMTNCFLNSLIYFWMRYR